MNHIKALYDIYYGIIIKANLLPSDFREEVEAKIVGLQKDLSFIAKAAATNDAKIFESVYIKYASDHNYESGFFFKKNYDLGEGWTAFLDAYRDGKVKGLQEWVARRRRTKKLKKKRKVKRAGHWANQIYSDNSGEYRVADIFEFINEKRIPVSDLNVATLAAINLVPSPQDTYTNGDIPGSPKFMERAAEASLTYPILVIKYDDGMFIADGVHRLWKAQSLGHETIKGHVISSTDLKKVSKQIPLTNQASTLFPIDSYCDSKKNVEYWEEAADNGGEDNEAVKDFIKYIKEIKC